jgi:hypothetical protein
MSREHQSEPRITAADRSIAEARIRVLAQKVFLKRLARVDPSVLSGHASIMLMTMRQTLTAMERARDALAREAGAGDGAKLSRGPATVISLADVRAARELEVILLEPRHPSGHA